MELVTLAVGEVAAVHGSSVAGVDTDSHRCGPKI